MLDTIDRAEGDADFTSRAATVDNSNGERPLLLVGEFVGELLRETLEDPADLLEVENGGFFWCSAWHGPIVAEKKACYHR